jgi:hypothetical protein
VSRALEQIEPLPQSFDELLGRTAGCVQPRPSRRYSLSLQGARPDRARLPLPLPELGLWRVRRCTRIWLPVLFGEFASSPPPSQPRRSTGADRHQQLPRAHRCGVPYAAWRRARGGANLDRRAEPLHGWSAGAAQLARGADIGPIGFLFFIIVVGAICAICLVYCLPRLRFCREPGEPCAPRRPRFGVALQRRVWKSSSRQRRHCCA